jgi:hypothetical protein
MYYEKLKEFNRKVSKEMRLWISLKIYQYNFLNLS